MGIRLPVHSQCPCGLEVKGWINKPKPFQPTFLTMPCKCGSKFIVKCWRKDQQYKMNAEIIELSKRAEAIVSVDLGLKEPEDYCNPTKNNS